MRDHTNSTADTRPNSGNADDKQRGTPSPARTQHLVVSSTATRGCPTYTEQHTTGAPATATRTKPTSTQRRPYPQSVGRTLQHTASNGGTRQPSANQPGPDYVPPPWDVPADYTPPWDPSRQPATGTVTQSSSSGEAFPSTHAAQGGKPNAQPSPEATEQQGDAAQADPQAAAAAPEAAQGGQAGGTYVPPDAELDDDQPGGQGGGRATQRQYHEGHGDQRMRGKRFKAAVQAAFNQRGWTKGEDVTWKEVAHLVGLREEDEESEWARVLAEGPQRGARRQQARGGREQQPSHSDTAGGGPPPSRSVNFSAILNLHTTRCRGGHPFQHTASRCSSRDTHDTQQREPKQQQRGENPQASHADAEERPQLQQSRGPTRRGRRHSAALGWHLQFHADITRGSGQT